MNDAQDAAVIVDQPGLAARVVSCAHILAQTRDRHRGERATFRSLFAVMTAGNSSADVNALRDSTVDAHLDYESLIASANSMHDDALLDENDAAAMCYTSGTTGRPKGVLHSHRAIVLHSFAQGLVDTLGVGGRDILLPIVPMFHVDAWGLPFTGVLFGAGQVFPGP